jgi:hypothetical protein
MEEVEDAVLFDLANLCDQYQEEHLYNCCMSQLTKGVTLQNAVMWLVQAHACEGETAAKVKSTAMGHVSGSH